MFESAVDGFGGSVGCSGSVEVGEDVGSSFVQCAAQRGDLDECGRNSGAKVGDQLGEEFSTVAAVLVPVGGDHALVDAPGRLEFDVEIGDEQRPQPVGLFVAE